MDLAKDQGSHGGLGHRGSDGSTPWERIARYGVVSGGIGEVATYGTFGTPGDPRRAVLAFIVDDGVADRGHRILLFDPSFTLAGQPGGLTRFTHEWWWWILPVGFCELPILTFILSGRGSPDRLFPTLMSWIEALGAAMRHSLEYAGDLAHLAARTVGGMLRFDRARARSMGPVLKSQLRFTGENAIWLVAGAGAILGAVTLLQAYAQLAGFGPGKYTGTLLSAVILRELGPVLAAVLVIGRSGTAIAAELGTMRLGEEVDALEAHGVDPYQYLLIPRWLGVTGSLFALMIFLDAAALLAGYGVAAGRLGTEWSVFWGQVRAAIDLRDFGITVLKALCFGSLITLQSSYFGLSVKASQTEIPQVVTKAVVAALISVFVLDGLFAALLYG